MIESMTEKEKMLSGAYYRADDTELIELRKQARLLFEKYNKTSITQEKQRYEILKNLLGSMGQQIFIEPNFRCDYGCNIHVGENFYANFDCVILDCAKVTIGKNCLLAPGVNIYTATHPIEAPLRQALLENAKPVTIGDDCWIGGNAVINPGVTLGDRVVVASGSVVTKSFKEDVVIGGNPARILKEIGQNPQ